MQVKDKSIADLVRLADEARREWAWYQARAEVAAQHAADWRGKADEALSVASRFSAQLDECVAEIQRRRPMKEGK